MRSQIDSDGDEDFDSERFFAYDGNQIVLDFAGDAASDLSHRYLWGPAVDQILADESVASLTSAGDVLWPLTDHLNTTRDLAEYDSGTDTTSIASHRIFDSFGNLVSESAPAITTFFGFTARPFDVASGLQWNLNRWYVSTLGVWMSEDPIGFAAGDANLRRYVSNRANRSIDPSGLAEPWFPGWVYFNETGTIQGNGQQSLVAVGGLSLLYGSLNTIDGFIVQPVAVVADVPLGAAEVVYNGSYAISGTYFIRPGYQEFGTLSELASHNLNDFREGQSVLQSFPSVSSQNGAGYAFAVGTAGIGPTVVGGCEYARTGSPRHFQQAAGGQLLIGLGLRGLSRPATSGFRMPTLWERITVLRQQGDGALAEPSSSPLTLPEFNPLRPAQLFPEGPFELVPLPEPPTPGSGSQAAPGYGQGLPWNPPNWTDALPPPSTGSF